MPITPLSFGTFQMLLSAGIRWVLIASAFFVPLAASPATADPLFGKVALVQVLAVVIGTAWLLQTLAARRISYKRMPLNVAFLAVAVTLLASTVTAHAPWSSFWGPDPTGEKAATFLALIVIAFVAAATLRREDVIGVAGALAASVAFLALHAAVIILAGRFGWPIPSWLAVNPAGSVNALAEALAAGFLFSAALFLSIRRASGVSRWLWALAFVATVLSGAVVLVTAFHMVWVGIAASLLFLIAFGFVRAWRPSPAASGEDKAADEYPLGRMAFAAAFLLLAASMFFVIRPPGFTARIFQPPVEISPSLVSTLAISRAALQAEPLFGVGPADFLAAFSRYRDASLNQTPFWQVRFPNGFSFFSALPATLGLAGLAAFTAFTVFAFVLIVRSLWKAPESDPFLWAFGIAGGFVLFEWLLYQSNPVSNFILFLSLGAVAVLGAEARPGSARGSWWRTTRRSILIGAPAVHFVTSLVAVFDSAFSFAALWAVASLYTAEVYARSASDALGRYGNTDTARVFFERAALLNPTERAYPIGQARTSLVALNRIIGQAAASPEDQDLPGRFQAEFSRGAGAVEQALRKAPDDPQSWALRGQLYESVIPFIPGADRAAADSYERAAAGDPLDPLLPFLRARAWMAAADVAGLQAGERAGQERERFDALRRDALASSAAALEEALRLKPDFADAHFLSAQAYLRQGNVGDAIRKVEETARLAPADIGVAFQLGFLYYRTGEFAGAEREFKRAIAIDNGYANARYFLGLILERRGERARALAEFRKIESSNPGNEEVLRIMANLSAGRSVLDGILSPPEARPEAPVRSAPRR
ncbi:MAG: tetratricopeptide repeat protein [bacterium]|nr:tetratricopeptide repeat protein [bacterium]